MKNDKELNYYSQNNKSSNYDTDKNDFTSSVLIVYSNPQEKFDINCETMLQIAKNTFNTKKLEIIDINKVSFLPSKRETSKQNSSNLDNNSGEFGNIKSATNNKLQKLNDIGESEKNSYVKQVSDATLTIFIFPLIFGSCPGKLKIWLEIIYNDALNVNNDKNQIFSNGVMKGKISMVLCSSPYSEDEYGYKGKFILSIEEILEHLTHGCLGLYGYSVLPSFFIYKIKPTKKKVSKKDFQEYNEATINDYTDRFKELNTYLNELENTELVHNYL